MNVFVAARELNGSLKKEEKVGTVAPASPCESPFRKVG